MKEYLISDILQIAKRFNNTKRTYLLVNPLQAKHIPVSPTVSLDMMQTLGNILAEKYPNTKLVIGFAETATAIGAVVAECFSPNCIYVHTTREMIADIVDWVQFSEEHSHATEQKLNGNFLPTWISKTDSILFVDDEISTGKTLINIIEQLRKKYPQLENKTIVVASLINRISDENMRKITNAGIICESLLKISEDNYSKKVEKIPIREASPVVPEKLKTYYQALFCDTLYNPRNGVQIGSYKHNCEEVAETFLAQFIYKIKSDSNILVLGTEECMYPALRIGAALEQMGQNYRVRCHATTRSPIGICEIEGYPITSGYRIRSFYENNRNTYIYNLHKYDVVIIVSDTRLKGFDALEDLAGALVDFESTQLFYLQGGKNVWCTKILL